MPEDIAIMSSKSDIDPCSHGRDTDRQKSADGRIDRRTDGFSVYLQIVSMCTYVNGNCCIYDYVCI